MGRWRPPAENSTALITSAGHARLKVELDELWRIRRPDVVKALAAAAAEATVPKTPSTPTARSTRRDRPPGALSV